MKRWFRPRPDPRDAVIDLLRTELHSALDRCHGLTERLVELQREGFRPPAPSAVTQSVSDYLPDIVTVAIAQRAGTNGELTQELVTYAQSRLLVNTKPDDVATEILNAEWQ